MTNTSEVYIIYDYVTQALCFVQTLGNYQHICLYIYMDNSRCGVAGVVNACPPEPES